MMIYNINDVERLFNTLDSCNGDVRITLQDGAEYEWHEDRKIMKSLIRGLGINAIPAMHVDVDQPLDQYKMAMHVLKGH